MASKKYNTKGARNQDLIAARAELKQFRHDVAILKKKGILDKTIYDARKVNPTRYLKDQIKRFANVISGEAAPVKVKRSKLSEYIEQGYTVKSGRAIVPKLKNETVRVSKAGFSFKASGVGGSITRYPLKFNPNDPNGWEDQIRKYGGRLGPDDRLAYQYFGNNSHGTYGKRNIEKMIDVLRSYPSFQQTEDSYDEEAMGKLIDGITLFKIDRTGTRPPPNPIIAENAEGRKQEATRRRRERYERRLANMSDKEEARFYQEKAERERERRKALKNDGSKSEQYKEAARQRAAKSRQSKKAK